MAIDLNYGKLSNLSTQDEVSDSTSELGDSTEPVSGDASDYLPTQDDIPQTSSSDNIPQTSSSDEILPTAQVEI